MSRPTPRPTPLRDFHIARGARLTDFAGWELPLQYKDGGFIAEHLAVREAAGFFDVSHMGQASVVGKDAAAALSRLLPADIDGMTPGQSKYTQLLNDNGGIVDDLIVGRETDGFFVVVNASRKEIDFDLMEKTFSQFADAQLRLLPDWALVAVQGPGAVAAVAAAFPAARELSFMESLWAAHQGAQCRISRSGYTGEDGFEISAPAAVAPDLAAALCAPGFARPCGLGARDSLRLEAALPLYGSDLNEETTPVEAGLLWSIPKSRRASGGFVGAAALQERIRIGAAKKLVGIAPREKTPVRGGAVLLDSNDAEIGVVTSGVFSPTLKKPIALGYVRADLSPPGNEIFALVRGKKIACDTAATPFVPRRYYRRAG